MTHGADTSFLVAVKIVEHEHHADALRVLNDVLDKGDRVALAPQVLAEFVHVVTDWRRFERPLSVARALDKSERWWNACLQRVIPRTRDGLYPGSSPTALDRYPRGFAAHVACPIYSIHIFQKSKMKSARHRSRCLDDGLVPPKRGKIVLSATA